MKKNSNNENQIEILKQHFNLFYKVTAECKLAPNASFEKINGVYRCQSGIPIVYNNAVIGSLDPEYDWDNVINEQLRYFNKAKMPFVWYVDENSNQKFKDKLKDHGFKDGGIFQGVIGSLTDSLPTFETSRDCKLERVRDEKSLDEFNDLVCATFDIKGIGKELYRKVLWDLSQGSHPQLYHWIARKEGRAISAVSTLIEGDLVSFWNGATLPECRRNGVSSALRRLALSNAVANGARLGMSYLMSEGMALGICKKFGYQPKWRFNVFLSS